MIKFIAIASGAGVIGISMIVIALGGDEKPSFEPFNMTLAPKEGGTNILDARMTRADTTRSEILKQFENAPDHIIFLAANISNPDVSLVDYAASIQSLGKEEINLSYGSPYPDTMPTYGHTLLRQAVVSGNTGAAALLLDQGASVFYNDNEMAFHAVRLFSNRRDLELRFPDYRSGSSFLRMWLDEGGTPNITHPLYGGGTSFLLSETPVNNLEGILMLLEAGADPWEPFDVNTSQGKLLYKKPSFFVSLATAESIKLEVSFRAAVAGHFANPPASGRADLDSAYEFLANKFRDPKSEAELNMAWVIGKTVQQIYDSFDDLPSTSIQNIRSRGFSPDIGGFFLGPDQFRSPPTSDQRVTSRDQQFGENKWLVEK